MTKIKSTHNIINKSFLSTPYNLSEYDKYILLSDNSNSSISPTYSAYIIFKQIKKVFEIISKSTMDSYIYNGKEYPKLFDSESAGFALNKINAGKYDTKIKLIANQLKLNLIIPLKTKASGRI